MCGREPCLGDVLSIVRSRHLSIFFTFFKVIMKNYPVLSNFGSRRFADPGRLASSWGDAAGRYLLQA